MMQQIVIIGCGQLGSRYLQAVKQVTIPLAVCVYDPSPSALENAKIRFNEVPGVVQLSMVTFVSKISDIPESIDLAVIATTADVRRQAIDSLLGQSRIRMMILEKVLFQRQADYPAMVGRLRQAGCVAWVNCPRRVFAFYRHLKGLLQGNDRLNIMGAGNNWGLACNAIHLIDLFCFLAGSTEYRLDASGLAAMPIPARRQGFYETSGTLTGIIDNRHTFAISSFQHTKDSPFSLVCYSEKVHAIIHETEKQAMVAEEQSGWKWQALPLNAPYLSEYMPGIITDLLTRNSCDLTPFEESVQIHLPLINTLQQYFAQFPSTAENGCPIT